MRTVPADELLLLPKELDDLPLLLVALQGYVPCALDVLDVQILALFVVLVVGLVLVKLPLLEVLVVLEIVLLVVHFFGSNELPTLKLLAIIFDNITACRHTYN